MPAVVLSTAHPAKFPEIVERALGAVPPVPERLAAFWEQPTDVSTLDPTPRALKDELLAYA